MDFEPWVSFPSLTATSSITGWYRSERVSMALTVAGSSAAPWTSVFVNPYSGLYDIGPTFLYDTTGGQEQRKGYLISASYYSPATPANYDTINNAVEGRSRVKFQNYFYPWPHGQTPVL